MTHEPRAAFAASALRATGRNFVTLVSGRERVTTREGVTRRLALTAMQGGMLAQRTHLEHPKAGDERWHRERRANFAVRREHQDKARSAIAAARHDGRPEPELCHIRMIPISTRGRLRSTAIGPMDEAGVEAATQARALQRLGFEMSVHPGEDHASPTEAGQEGRIGPCMIR